MSVLIPPLQVNPEHQTEALVRRSRCAVERRSFPVGVNPAKQWRKVGLHRVKTRSS